MPPTNATVRPRGFLPIGIFFIFGATMATFAAATLLFPGTSLDALWALNKRGHEGLTVLGRLAAIPFVVLSPALALAAAGWLSRRRWGWILGVTIIAINMVGDLSQIIFGEPLKGAFGVAIAGMLLAYMTLPTVRAYFKS